jgi:arginyl-tRNA synthetase
MLLAWLKAHARRADLEAGASAAHAGETWVVDYSSPQHGQADARRPPALGRHRRGDLEALAFTGARVVRDNHIGDWGTQYGKLIWACKRHLDEAALARDPIEEFERLYKLGNAAAEPDPAVMEEARAELVKLQAGDPENLALWKGSTRRACRRSRDLRQLGIRFDETLGESFYNDKVEQVYGELSAAGSRRRARARRSSSTPSTPGSRPSR